jgi:hypothetical protein
MERRTTAGKGLAGFPYDSSRTLLSIIFGIRIHAQASEESEDRRFGTLMASNRDCPDSEGFLAYA